MKPIISIWIKTRQTFLFIEKRNKKINNKTINILFFLSSLSFGFYSWTGAADKYQINYYVGLILFLLLSGVFGLLIWRFVMSYIIWGTGKIFKGEAPIQKIRIVLAFLQVPNLVLLIISFVMIIPAIILDNKDLIGFENQITKYILWIFALRIGVIGLSHFNKFSYLYALLTLIIPPVIFQAIVYGFKLMA